MKMTYAITQEQEKTALNEALQGFWYNDKIKSLSNQSLLLSDIAEMTDIKSADKIHIICSTLSDFSHEFDVFHDDQDEINPYLTYKNHFAKYVNQDLFGAISGVSFTAEHFKNLYDNNLLSGDSYFLLETSLPFSFIKQVKLDHGYFDEITTLPTTVNQLTIDDFVKASTSFSMLELNHFPHSDSHYQNMIDCLRLSPVAPSHLLSLLAACPRTNHMLTREDFMACIKNNDLESDELYNLAMAYKELFHEELTTDNVAL